MTHNKNRLVEGLSLETFKEGIGPVIVEEEDERFGNAMGFSTHQEIMHEYNRDKVRQALRKAGDRGATSTEISKMTHLAPQTAKKYLEELRAIREAYGLKRNRTTTIYHINGRPRHDFGFERVEDGNMVFEMSLAEGPDDTLLLHIVEKRFTLLEGEQVEGGVILPIRLIPSIIEKMGKFHELAGGDARG